MNSTKILQKYLHKKARQYACQSVHFALAQLPYFLTPRVWTQNRFKKTTMADDTAPSPSDASTNALDLNSLSGLNFGPDWADGKSSGPSNAKRFEEKENRKGKRSGPPNSRDRRSGGLPKRGQDDRENGPQRGHANRDSRRQHSKPVFEPTVDIDLYPQDEAFDALVKRLKTSARTYQLFEIAHLLLEKPERYVVVVSPRKHRADKEEAKPLLYYSVPGHLPFETEEQAINYVLKEHIDQFFEVEEVEVDAPKGNFLMVNRCGITGQLLGPPNYHRYQEFVQRHYSSHINGMSFDRYQSKIESTREQEDIDAWLESMKKGARYTVKDRKENEPESLDSLEAAKHFLLAHRKEMVVGSGESVRFAGRDIERMPRGNIRRSVEVYVEQQKHFPLDSANNIRGRLRRHKFAVYKKGSKGVSFVCAVKRKFRDSKTVFTDSIRDLIDFIEKHPDIPASKLSKEYIGIDTEKQKPDALEMKDEASDSPVPAAENETTPETAESAVDEAEAELIENKETSTQAQPKSDLSEAEQKKLNQLMLDLRWLITEGYVTEYGDGRLFAPAPLPEPSKKPIESGSKDQESAGDEKSSPEKAPAAAEAPSDSTEKVAEATEAPETPEATETIETAETEGSAADAVAKVESSPAESEAGEGSATKKNQ